jgi:hypothetical protein
MTALVVAPLMVSLGRQHEPIRERRELAPRWWRRAAATG